MDVQVQVAGQITSKPTANGGTKFDIPLSNGTKPSTFDALLATKVSQFGQSVFTARLEQKGKYTNIIAAAGPGEQLPPEIPQAGAPIGQQAATPFQPVGAQGASTPIVPASSGGGGGAWSPETTTRVTKLAVQGSAYAFVGSLIQGAGLEAMEQAVEFADALAKKLYLDARSHEPAALPQPQQPAVQAVVEQPAALPVAADPQAVAAFVTQEAGASAVQVGAAGIAAAADTPVGAGEPVAVLPWTTA